MSGIAPDSQVIDNEAHLEDIWNNYGPNAASYYIKFKGETTKSPRHTKFRLPITESSKLSDNLFLKNHSHM